MNPCNTEPCFPTSGGACDQMPALFLHSWHIMPGA